MQKEGRRERLALNMNDLRELRLFEHIYHLHLNIMPWYCLFEYLQRQNLSEKDYEREEGEEKSGRAHSFVLWLDHFQGI